MEFYIIGGDPAQGPASYTRFVLPFAYRPVALSGVSAGPAYLECLSPDPDYAERLRARSDYFTAETSSVLFDRAKWVQLSSPLAEKSEAPNDFEVRGRQAEGNRRKKLKVRLKPARLVLFEWPGPEPVRGEPDLLSSGFLVQEANFLNDLEPWAVEDVLAFNDMFRLWRCPFQGYADIQRDGYLYKCLVPGADCSGDVFFDRWAPLLHCPVQTGSGQSWLFPGASNGSSWSAEARKWALEGARQPGWVAYADTRTFVWTCMLLQNGVDSLREGAPLTARSDARGPWLKLLNVDSPGSDIFSLTEFEKQWLNGRTYSRWEESGTVYGFSYHSGAMIAGPCTGPPLWRHFGDMYFDLTLLLLYLRVGSFRFSRRLNEISERMRSPREESLREFTNDYRSLRLAFALFTNLYQFPLLSNQQQGLEMYEIARSNLDVKELFCEVQDKIKTSHEYLEARISQDQVDTTVRLTVVATLGLALILALNFLALDVVAGQLKDGLRRSLASLLKTWGWDHWAWIPSDLLLFAVTIGFFWLLIRYVARHADSLLPWVEPRRGPPS